MNETQIEDIRRRLFRAVVRVCPHWLAVTLHLQGRSVPEVASIPKWRTKRAENHD